MASAKPTDSPSVPLTLNGMRGKAGHRGDGSWRQDPGLTPASPLEGARRSSLTSLRLSKLAREAMRATACGPRCAENEVRSHEGSSRHRTWRVRRSKCYLLALSTFSSLLLKFLVLKVPERQPKRVPGTVPTQRLSCLQGCPHASLKECPSPCLSPQLDLPFVDSKNQNQNHQLENTVRLVSAQTGLWV